MGGLYAGADVTGRSWIAPPNAPTLVMRIGAGDGSDNIGVDGASKWQHIAVRRHFVNIEEWLAW